MKANDMKKMREAVKLAMSVLCRNKADAPYRAWCEYDNAIEKCKAALAAPARNRDERCLGHNISECARAALDSPPRACDVMSQEDLTKVVISGFMKSLGIGPENQLVSELTVAAISAAIRCAYDTQLVSKGEESAK